MNKKVLVTGVDNSSIAKSICVKFANQGYDVIATYEKQSNFDELGIKNCIKVDFRNSNSVTEFVKSLSDKKFDCIVNCPAILATTNDGDLRDEFIDFNYQNFSEVISYNVCAIAAICIGLKDNIMKEGCIINITSSAANEGAFATISYNASKAAVNNLTMSLANNFGLYNGVRVNSVAPGWIPPSGDVVDDSIVALATAMTPTAQRGRPENVADLVYSIAENPFISGANYEVDGGITSSYLMYMLESIDLRGNDTKKIIYELASKIKDGKKKLKTD